jgi:hypothetical protein
MLLPNQVYPKQCEVGGDHCPFPKVSVTPIILGRCSCRNVRRSGTELCQFLMFQVLALPPLGAARLLDAAVVYNGSALTRCCCVNGCRH